MPHRWLGIAALAFAGLAAANLAIAGVPRLLADRKANAIPVDVELVIAVDVSYSMDPEEQALQREGYILALTSKEFLQALRQARMAGSPSLILNGPVSSTRRSSCRGG